MTTHRPATRTARAGEFIKEARHPCRVARTEPPGWGTDRSPSRWRAIWLRLRAGWCGLTGHRWIESYRRAGMVRRCVACGSLRLAQQVLPLEIE